MVRPCARSLPNKQRLRLVQLDYVYTYTCVLLPASHMKAVLVLGFQWICYCFFCCWVILVRIGPIRNAQLTIYNSQYTTHNIHLTIHTSQYTLKYTPHNIPSQYTPHNTHFTIYTSQYIPHNIHQNIYQFNFTTDNDKCYIIFTKF
jgi:hypothetical protein